MFEPSPGIGKSCCTRKNRLRTFVANDRVVSDGSLKTSRTRSSSFPPAPLPTDGKGHSGPDLKGGGRKAESRLIMLAKKIFYAGVKFRVAGERVPQAQIELLI